RLRNGGQRDRYHHEEFGVNSRLDEMQAAILRARVAGLPGWTAERRALAAEYRRRLADAAVTVPRQHDPGHVYHLFPILSPERDALQAHFKGRGVETLIHYPVPIPRQPALASERPGACPAAHRACAEVLSLPLYPGLSLEAVEEVAAALDAFHAPAGCESAARCSSSRSSRRSSRSSKRRSVPGGTRKRRRPSRDCSSPTRRSATACSPTRARATPRRSSRPTLRSTRRASVTIATSGRNRAAKSASSCSAIRWCCRCRWMCARPSAACSKSGSTATRDRSATA